MPNPEALFFLLSDLHFGPDLDTELVLSTDDLRCPFPIPDTFHNYLINYLIDHCCLAHDIAILKQLPRYLTRLLAELRDEGFKKDDFDLYLILGDLATWPSTFSFEFLRQYLTADRCLARARKPYDEPTIDCPGLHISTRQLVMIPGNHDKLFRVDLSLYHQHFLLPLALPMQPRAGQCFLTSRNINGVEFLFWLVEPSVYATADCILDTTCRHHVASGEIIQELREEIK